MKSDQKRSIGCIIPARNEEGNLERVLDCVLSIKEINQVVIVEGGSTDNTFALAMKLQESNSDRVTVLRQNGKGKFDAVLVGVNQLKTEQLLIWDADNTVDLRDTVTIVELAALNSTAVMGDRLHGLRDKGSMRFANWIGNWFFALLWAPFTSWKARDTLCGTKVFPREVLTTIPSWMLKNDPFGDFTIIANAYRLKIPIIYKSVHYQARTYGATNIRRWRSGLILLKFTLKLYLHRLQSKDLV